MVVQVAQVAAQVAAVMVAAAMPVMTPTTR
jgi:hypothetical protein